MKTRNGFVSNSSSSSFIVVFPYKPHNAKEVLDIMFGGKEGSINDLTYSEISTRVFDDIKSKKAKKLNLKMANNEFINMYYSYCYKPFRDVINGDYKDFIELNNKFKKKEEPLKIIKKELEKNIASAKYAVKGGINPYTNKLYTENEVADYNNYLKELDEFYNTEEWKEINNKQKIIDKEYGDEFRKLSNDVAKKEAKKFMEENAGKYVFIVEYSDESGDSTMEHGNIFRKVSNIQISHH